VLFFQREITVNNNVPMMTLSISRSTVLGVVWLAATTGHTTVIYSEGCHTPHPLKCCLVAHSSLARHTSFYSFSVGILATCVAEEFAATDFGVWRGLLRPGTKQTLNLPGGAYMDEYACIL